MYYFSKQFLRCQTYANEFKFLNFLSSLFGFKLKNDKIPWRLRINIIKEVFREIYKDAKRTADLEYLPEDDKVFWNKEHFNSYFNILKDFPSVIKRRKNLEINLNNQKNYPKYFNRSFHFQTDGYTSEHSAKLYDHQVEILFSGLASIMRKMLITAVNKNFGKIQGRVLELGSGTGVGAKLLAKHYPGMQIISTDLSEEYIQFAQKNNQYKNIEFQISDASNLSQFENQFDICFHIFLLHEVPKEERRKIILEQLRVLKAGGIGIIIESIQEKDRPEWKPILDDFPKRYHEPFYKNYVQNPIEETLEELGAQIIDRNQILFSKCIVFKAL